jgi:xeroderma pigmentosum group C-complementing protein
MSLQARLVSITPLALQTSLLMIHKKTQPDPIRRARLFESALFKLTEWWHSTFRVIPNKGVRSQTFAQVQQAMSKSKCPNLLFDSQDFKGKGKAIDLVDDENSWSDRLRSPKSLMKHALLREGSAETSSMLFTSLCRALDIPARLVVSLQPCPWSSKLPVGKSEPPLEGWPPIMWTEVFSRPESRWIPVDPIRYLIDKRKLLEPMANCSFNRLVYVVAFEEGMLIGLNRCYKTHGPTFRWLCTRCDIALCDTLRRQDHEVEAFEQSWPR